MQLIEVNYKMIGGEHIFMPKITQEGSLNVMIPETVRANQQPEVPQSKGPDPHTSAKGGGWNATRPGHSAKAARKGR